MTTGLSDTAVSQERILYWDNSFAVFLKFPGDLCERILPAQNTGISLNILAENRYIEKTGKRPECAECVHRLDQSVTGLVLLAFDRRTLRKFSEAFASGAVQKEYWAVVEGVLPGGREWNTLVQSIRFFPSVKKAKVLPWDGRPQKNNWQRAELSWRVMGAGDRYTFLAVRPQTGKTHQIRAQLASRGMHIKGDVKYGSRRSENSGGIRLHACSLRFAHPVTKEEVSVFSPPPVIDALWEACIKCAQNQ